MSEESFFTLIRKSKYLVVLTGAGISTESGLSDFRGPQGVWTRRDKGLKPLLSPPIETIKPNNGHMAIVKLFELGKLKFLISQNVDNLHLKSGISYENLAELHGNHNLFKCLNCDRRYTAQEIQWDKNQYGPGYRKDKPHINQPACPTCQGRLISSIVNFGDPMPEKEMKLATYHARKADTFMVIGSSLVVEPAASLPLESYDNGGSIIILNKGKTGLDDIAELKIESSVGDILEKLIHYLQS